MWPNLLAQIYTCSNPNIWLNVPWPFSFDGQLSVQQSVLASWHSTVHMLSTGFESGPGDGCSKAFILAFIQCQLASSFPHDPDKDKRFQIVDGWMSCWNTPTASKTKEWQII